MKGCTFPGNTISCDGAESWGETTETDCTAICAVSARTVAALRRRARTPYPKIPAKARRATPAISQPRFEWRGALPARNVSGWSAGLCTCDCIDVAITNSPSEYLLLPDFQQRPAGGNRG